MFILSCSNEQEEKNKLANNLKKKQIEGEWSILDEKQDFESIFSYENGVYFLNDSVELFRGYYEAGFDTIRGERCVNYYGNKTSYTISNDSIFIRNPITKKWGFFGKIGQQKNDTLNLQLTDTTYRKLCKLPSKLDTFPYFDQIILSTSGCFGSCPISNISINRMGEIIFKGEGYVKHLGYYHFKLNKKSTDRIFTKFRRANLLRLNDYYSVGHTDDETTTTTFIKDGKIIKSIYDYGNIAPKELNWAYSAIRALDYTLKMDSIYKFSVSFPKISSYTISKENKETHLSKSESFLLWIELQKAKTINTNFTGKYTITNTHDYDYWGGDPNPKEKQTKKIKTLTTNGRIYKFEFEDNTSSTFDLGYNFIENNFKPSDFHKKGNTICIY